MIPKKLVEILDDLDLFPDRTERIQALISIAEEFKNPSAEELKRTSEGRVPGCESEVFIDPNRIRFAVDNPQGISAMALARILEQGLAGAAPDEIEAVSEDVVYRVFGRDLSMGKSMGLTGMVRKAKSVGQR